MGSPHFTPTDTPVFSYFWKILQSEPIRYQLFDTFRSLITQKKKVVILIMPFLKKIYQSWDNNWVIFILSLNKLNE